MNRYKVHVCRTAYRHLELTIPANSKTEAKVIAEATAGNYDFPSEKEAIYTVEGIVRV